MPSVWTPLFVIPAIRSQTWEIFPLINPGLGANQLRFTPFLSPSSIALLSNQIDSSRYTNLVGLIDGRVVGLASGRALGDLLHLNYLSVRPEARAQGVGRSLLSAFEEAAQTRGKPGCSLDVYESNPVAISLYRSMGYQEVDRHWSCGLPPSNLVETRTDLDLGFFEEALAEEKRQGASTFSAVLDGVSIMLGLVGGKCLRILDSGGKTLDELAPALSTLLQKGRDWMILTGLTELPAIHEPSFSERSIRMVKQF